MSNVVNKIIAIVRDTSVSASSQDGTSWLEEDAQDFIWQVSQGSTGKYLYATIDRYNPLAMVNYSIIDNTNWTAGVLPTPQLSCINVIARGLDGITVSYNGSSFNQVVPRVYSNSSVYGRNKVFQTCSAVSTSTGYRFNNLNAQLFFVTCIAKCVSIIPDRWVREWWTTPPQWLTTSNHGVVYNANEKGTP